MYRPSTLFYRFKHDLPAGIVVFFVALPLCLGIALAGGAPLFSGMIAGILGGIVVGSLSNSPLSVSGPAAGLVSIIFVSITTLGSFEAFLVAVIIAGIIQILLGVIKAGMIANYFPSNVIKGMLTAIGIIIILKQLPIALGYGKTKDSLLSFLQHHGPNALAFITEKIQYIDLGATTISLLSIVIMLLWESRWISAKLKIIPGGLIAVAASIALSQLIFKHYSFLLIEPNHFVQVPIAHNLSEFYSFFKTPDFDVLYRKDIYAIGLTIAIVASIESLLSVEAIDKLDRQRRVTNPNRELLAQGIGNILSGLLGGLPITSVIVRSSANFNANAQSKFATIIHGNILLICVIGIPSLLNMIPLAALASILLLTGFKLCKPSIFIGFFQKSKYQWVPFVVTVLAIVFTDLLYGVAIGLATSVSAILVGNFKNSFVIFTEQTENKDLVLVHFSEEVSFLNKAEIRKMLDHLPKNSSVILDASDSKYIDFDVQELIREFIQLKAPHYNIQCHTIGFKEDYKIHNSDSASEIKEKYPVFEMVIRKTFL